MGAETTDHTSGQHFWHQLTSSRISDAVEATQAAVSTSLELCNQVLKTSVPKQLVSFDESTTELDLIQTKLEDFLQNNNNEIPISAVLHAMVESAVMMHVPGLWMS